MGCFDFYFLLCGTDEVVTEVDVDLLADDCVEYFILLYTNDTVYVYSVSGIRPDITTPPPILPSPITLGLSVTVTGVVPSMVVLNVNIMLLTVVVTVTTRTKTFKKRK